MTIIKCIVGTLLLIIGWHLLVLWFNLPKYILPDPWSVFMAIKTEGHYILRHTWATTEAAILGWLAALPLSIVYAIIVYHCNIMGLLLHPLLLISQALPIFAIAPLIVIWFGYGMLTKVIIIAFMLFFPIASSFYDGLATTAIKYLDLAKVMNATKRQLLWRIRIPLALPSLGSGIKISATLAPMGAVLGEWMGTNEGLGMLILSANSQLRIDLMFAAIFFLALLTLFFYHTINFLTVKLISSNYS